MRSYRKGSVKWTDEIKKAIQRKRKAYKKMLDRNVEKISVRRRIEYKLLIRKVKEFVKD